MDKKLFKLALWVLAAALFGYGIGSSTIKVQQVEAQPGELTAREMVEIMKGAVIEKIAACETGGEKAPADAAVYDPAQGQERSANAISYGPMQFKVDTIKDWKKKQGQEITTLQAINIAMSDTEAKALASDIIFSKDRPGGVYAWRNCGGKYAKEVEVIKQMQAYAAM